jgi:hypothetical protein
LGAEQFRDCHVLFLRWFVFHHVTSLLWLDDLMIHAARRICASIL